MWLPEHAEYRAIADSGLGRLSEVDHARVRKLVSSALTPRSVERMRNDIQRTVDEILDTKIRDGKLDIRAFADLLPLRVISDMLKISDKNWPEFRVFGQATIKMFDPANTPMDYAAILHNMTTRWVGMLRELVGARGQNPLPDDLLSTLIAARDEAAKLSEDELLGLVQALITGGADTTVHAICYVSHSLLGHRDALAEVQAKPALLRNAIEESLRFDSFVKGGIPKFCREAFEFCGVPLRRGQLVYYFSTAANHDPEAFPEPERFNIHRDQSNFINFGIGQYYCLGAALARMTLELAVGTLIQRFPALQLIEEPEIDRHYLFRPMKSLFVSLHH
jgi:cytochrome P450 enzyme